MGKRRIAAGAACLLIVLAGCRDDSPPPKIQVKGTVTVADEGPLTGGSIQFVLAEDPTKAGGAQIQGDGSYDVFAPRGECKVIVANEHLLTGGKTGTANMPPGGIAVPPGAVSRGLAHMPIDPCYAAFKTTPLTSIVTVDGASPTDFELQPPPSDEPAADDEPAEAPY